jgi:hypothetical protein
MSWIRIDNNRRRKRGSRFIYGYNCNSGAALFDGTNDWLKRSSDLTGNADGSKGTLVLWVTWVDGSYVLKTFLENGSNFAIERTFAGFISATLKNAAGTSSLIFRTFDSFFVGAVPTPQDYTPILISWDTNFGIGSKKHSIWVNGSNRTLLVTDANTAFNVDYTSANWGIGATSGGANKWGGAIGHFYFDNQSYYDFSIAANVDKFVYTDPASGKRFPAYSGAKGEYASGAQPIIFLNCDSPSFNQNIGTGGDFIVTGALTEAAPKSPCVLGSQLPPPED